MVRVEGAKKPHVMNSDLWVRVFLILGGATLLRIYLALNFPLANDEAYYWDWTHSLALSYIDHPPGVSVAGWLSSLVFGGGTFGVRMSSVILHGIAVIISLKSMRLILGRELHHKDILTLLALTELIPIFSMTGVVFLPDGGLYCFIALAGYFFLKLLTSPRIVWAILAGGALGLAGLFKYHAGPIALGMGLWVLCSNKVAWSIKQRMLLLTIAAIVAIIVTGPVWLWNFTHDFASFRFQGDHGFGGMKLNVVAAIQVFIGQMIFLTPMVWLYPLLFIKKPLPSAYGAVLLSGFLVLVLLMDLAAFGKQLLPHWVGAGYWLIVPLLASALTQSKWFLRWTIPYGVIVTWCLPLVFAVPVARQEILNSFAGKPGALAELTLWPKLSFALAQDARFRELTTSDNPPIIAGFRWYYAAQLRSHLPNAPQVYNLDLSHPSYYHYRDDWQHLGRRQVLIVADKRHLSDEKLSELVTLSPAHPPRVIKVPDHEDSEILLIEGEFLDGDTLSQRLREVKTHVSY